MDSYSETRQRAVIREADGSETAFDWTGKPGEVGDPVDFEWFGLRVVGTIASFRDEQCTFHSVTPSRGDAERHHAILDGREGR